MTGRQRIGFKFTRPAQQQIEFEALIAHDTGIGRPPGKIFIAEVVDDLALEGFFKINDVEWDIEPLGHPAGVMHIIEGTAGSEGFAVGSREPAVVPYLHGHACDFMPLLLEQSRGDGGIHAAAHGDDNAFSGGVHGGVVRCPKKQGRRKIAAASLVAEFISYLIQE